MVVVPELAAPVIPLGTVAVHEILAPDVEEPKLTAVVEEPEQTDWFGCENVTAGLGFIIIL